MGSAGVAWTVGRRAVKAEKPRRDIRLNIIEGS